MLCEEFLVFQYLEPVGVDVPVAEVIINTRPVFSLPGRRGAIDNL